MNNAAFNVLKILDRESGKISGEKISEELGISRSAVWKHIEELRELGYEIDATQKEGYHVTGRTNRSFHMRLSGSSKQGRSDLRFIMSQPPPQPSGLENR